MACTFTHLVQQGGKPNSKKEKDGGEGGNPGDCGQMKGKGKIDTSASNQWGKDCALRTESHEATGTARG